MLQVNRQEKEKNLNWVNNKLKDLNLLKNQIKKIKKVNDTESTLISLWVLVKGRWALQNPVLRKVLEKSAITEITQ